MEATISPTDEGMRLPAFTYTTDDLIAVNWRKSSKRIISTFTAFAASNTALLYLGFQNPIVLAVAPLLIAGFVLVARYITIPRKLAKNLSNPAISGREFVITQEGLSWSVPCGISSTVLWKAIPAVESDRLSFVFNLPGGQFVVLPRRILGMDQEHYLVDRLRAAKLMP